MTIDQTDTLELLGLAGSFPRPGWVVLDAARDRSFTGEVRFRTMPEVTVSFDRGQIYVAERVTEPSLGARLVDAGLLTASELERGVIRLGTVEHIGRLFERVPSLDRHAVTLAAEMLTDECVSWLAMQHVASIEVIPYRHHPSGVLRWHQLSLAVVLHPGDPLPAPAPTDEPVESSPPSPVYDAIDAEFDAEFDDLIQWDQPGWLDQSDDVSGSAGPFGRTPLGSPDTTRAAGATTGATVRSSEPDVALTSELGGAVVPIGRSEEPTSGPDAVVATDDFELIWPSGDTEKPLDVPADQIDVPDDSEDGSTDGGADLTPPMPPTADAPPDFDEPGVALPVRVPHSVRAAEPATALARPLGAASMTVKPARLPGRIAVDPQNDQNDSSSHDGHDGDTALAVRRAVATIDTGSLASRRRLASSVDEDLSRGVAAELEQETGQMSSWSVRHTDMVVPIRRSVFDDVPAPAPVLATEGAALDDDVDDDDEPARTSALRRLIGSLRAR